MTSTTTTSNKHGVTTRHHIAPNHDFLIIVENYEVKKDSRTKRMILCVHEFEVTSVVLRKHGSFRLPSSDAKQELKIRERDPEALKVLPQVLHDFVDEASPDCRELLTPSYFFDHAEAFAAISLMLAINASRHIEERIPEGLNPGHLGHRLPHHRIIGAVNGARGSLRSKLLSRLYEPVSGLLRNATCKYKKLVLWSYFAALENTDAWSIESEGNKMSVQELLSLLGEFEYDKYDDPHPDDEPRTDRLYCGVNFDGVVTRAINDTRKQFDGLYLNNMKSASNEADDREYWNNSKCGYFSRSTCRIKHGRSSWYWSFLGKREKMDYFHEGERRAKEREAAQVAATFAKIHSQALAREVTPA